MQPSAPLACWQCGTVISAPGGRCPACGVEQSNPPSMLPGGRSNVTTTAPRGRSGTVIEPENGRSMPWVVLAVGLAAIAVLGILFAPRGSSDAEKPEQKKPAPSSSGALAVASSAPNELGVRDVTAVDPIEALGRARARAIAWHPDATLVSVYAAPVGERGIDLSTGGAVEYVFGRPTDEGFGAGAHLGPKKLTLSLTKTGQNVVEGNVTTARAALDPNCPFDEALRKVRASGVPTATQLVVAYEFSEKHGRTIFRVTSPGDDTVTRALDGQTCAILVR